MQDLYIPTHAATRMLGLSPRNTKALHRLKIPCQKDFTSLMWSRNAIYAELKRRRQLSHPPPGYLTLSEVAEKLGRSIPYTHHILKRHHIKPSYAPLWLHHTYRTHPIYSLKQIRNLLNEINYIKATFPPEGWLEIKDCVDYLSRTPENVRQLCRLHNIRIKKIHNSKYLYNEDDIIKLRKHLRSRRRKLRHDTPAET